MMFAAVFDLKPYQVALAFIFVFIVFVILRIRGINRDRELMISALRMTIQLIIVGYILTYIFDNPHPLITFGVVLLMTGFAIFTVFRKFKKDLTPSLKKVIAISLPLGGLPVLFYFLMVVVQVDPYYNPQYFIPITGMIVGNSMTGITLGINSMLKRYKTQVKEVEESLILGATPKEASNDIINDSFDAAIMPTINNMLGMGIIFLPGMMTGQILSGVVPTTAILYQITVMLGILGGVSLSTFIFLRMGYKTFFNKECQLIDSNKTQAISKSQ